jgi:predicted dehydrogenase
MNLEVKRMKTVSWGIIGCGDVTEVKSGPAFSRAPHSSLVAVMRRDGEKAADYARRHGVTRWYADAQALIDDPDVNAVYIATPPGSHCELALRVAAAGKPCYVEKPMARNAEECGRMIEAFRAAEQPLFVAYYRRALPHFRRIKSFIDTGEFGKPLSLNYYYANGAQRQGIPEDAWRFQPEISGGGLFWDLGSHALDLFDWWLGPLAQVSGHSLRASSNAPVEDRVGLTAVAGGSVSLTAFWNFIGPAQRDRIELTFEQGEIHCSVFGSTIIEIHPYSGESRREDIPHGPHIQQDLIETVVKALRGGSNAPSTGESALRTNRVIDQIMV